MKLVLFENVVNSPLFVPCLTCRPVEYLRMMDGNSVQDIGFGTLRIGTSANTQLYGEILLTQRAVYSTVDSEISSSNTSVTYLSFRKSII